MRLRKRKGGIDDYDSNWKQQASNCRKTGLDSSTISKCCRGVLKTTGGYHWEFVEKEEKKEV